MGVKEQLFDIVREYVEIPDDFDTSLNLKMAAGLNSFSMMSMAASIEESFDISIPNDALRSFRNMDDIIDYIEKSQN